MASSTFNTLFATDFFSHWPTDWIILGALAAFIAFDSLRNGSARAATLAVVAPLALLLVNLLPQTIILGPIAR